MFGGKLVGMSSGKEEEGSHFGSSDVLEFGQVLGDRANPQGEVGQIV